MLRGSYQVSNMGRVKSLSREVIHRDVIRKIKGRILKLKIDYNGYKACGLNKKGKAKIFQVHQLVCMAFLGHTPNGFKIVCDHINNIKLDNRLVNLQLITNRENISKDQRNRSSKYVGVFFHKKNKKWTSSIHINGKMKYLGIYDQEYDAHVAYQTKLEEILNQSKLQEKKVDQMLNEFQ